MKSSTVHRLSALSRHEDGQDLLEYAMLGGLIAIVAVGAVGTLGNTINTVLWQVIAAASF
jgi:Flp pilus assembly pilin Flp